MANANGIAVRDLLGRLVYVSEVVAGHRFEDSGRVVGIIEALPGSQLTEAFCIERDNGSTSEWLHLDDVSVDLVL